MAQVLVLGIVGCRVVDTGTKGQALADINTDPTRQLVGIAMFASCIGEGVLHNVEGPQGGGGDKGRARHVVARPVVVADAAESHGTRRYAIEGFYTDICLQQVVGLVEVDESPVALRQRDLGLGDILVGKACQSSRIAVGKPRIGLLHKLVVAEQ